MPDKESVKEWLEEIAFGHAKLWSAYYSEANSKKLANAALIMLKEQEPILLENQHKPYGDFLNANAPWISRCPRCGKKVEGKKTRFCKYCGQGVKWE